MLHFLSKQVDYTTRKAFESSRDLETLPTLDEFFEFLEKRCIILENISATDQDKQAKNSKMLYKPSLFTQEISSSKSQSCLHCKGSSHNIYTCGSFKTLHHNERKRFVLANRLCYNCLGFKLSVSNCPSSKNCSICSHKHHTLLHFDVHTQPRPSQNSASSRHHESRPIHRSAVNNCQNSNFGFKRHQDFSLYQSAVNHTNTPSHTFHASQNALNNQEISQS